DPLNRLAGPKRTDPPDGGSACSEAGKAGSAAADAGIALGQRRRGTGHREQGLRVAVLDADRGHFIPAEERRLAHPFRVRTELLHVEAVFLDTDQPADVADLGLILAVDVHPDHRGLRAGGLDHFADVVQREATRWPRQDVLQRQRLLEEGVVLVWRFQFGDVAMAHDIHAVVGDAVAHHPEQEELAADATYITAEAAVLEFFAPQPDQGLLLLRLAQLGALAGIFQFDDVVHGVHFSRPA